MADNHYCIISLDGLGEAAKLLIEKVSNAVGWVITRDTPMKIAMQSFIEDVKKSDLDPISKAALISNANTIVKEYCNQAAILQKALISIQDNAKPDLVEDDWISQFMDKARLISDSEFQVIWGRILAEECNRPGCIPRSLLHTLEQMDRFDAEQFTLLCSFSIYTIDNDGKAYSPIIIWKHMEELYEKKGISFDGLVNLKALGLIDTSIGKLNPEYTSQYNVFPSDIHYFDKSYQPLENMNQIPVGNVIFTKTGQALCQVIETKGHENFVEEYCIPYWKTRIKQLSSSKMKQGA